MFVLAPWSRRPVSAAVRLIAAAADMIILERNPEWSRGKYTWLPPEKLRRLVDRFVEDYEKMRSDALKDALAVFSREVLAPFFREIRCPTPSDEAEIDRRLLQLLRREGLDSLLGDDPLDAISQARYRRSWPQYLVGKNRELADQFCQSLVTGQSASSSTLQHQRRHIRSNPLRELFARSRWANGSIEAVSSAYHVLAITEGLTRLLRPEVEAQFLDPTIHFNWRLGGPRARPNEGSIVASSGSDSSRCRAAGEGSCSSGVESDPQSIPEIAETCETTGVGEFGPKPKTDDETAL